MPGVPFSYLPYDFSGNAFKESFSQSKSHWVLDALNIKSKAAFVLICVGFFLALISFPLFSHFSTSSRLVHLKPEHPDFTGRSQYLNHLKKICLKNSSELGIAVLFGEGGMGKSEIAVTFANQHLKDFAL